MLRFSRTRSAPIEAPIGPHGLDDHHFAEVLAREETHEYPFGIRHT
jgi:hypothetical protein